MEEGSIVSLEHLGVLTPMRPSGVGTLGKVEMFSWRDALYKCFLGVGMHVETKILIEDPMRTSC